MSNKRRIGIIVAAMIVAIQMGNRLDAAEPTLEELGKIAVFLDNNDVDALIDFLKINPDLLVGDAQISVLLRQFMDESSDVNAFFSLKEAGTDLYGDPNSWYVDRSATDASSTLY